MRILVISNFFPPDVVGGYEELCGQAVGHLRDSGHDVAVLTTVPRQPIRQRDSHVVRILRSPDVYSSERQSLRSPFWEFEANLLDVQNLYQLLQLLEDWKPDVCYLWNLIGIGGIGIVAALEYLGEPWVWHLADSVPAAMCHFEGPLPVLGQRMGRLLSGRFIVNSQLVLEAVERLMPIRDRTKVLPNWVIPDGNRRTAGIGDGVLRLAHAPGFVGDPSVFEVIECLALLTADDGSGIHLDLIGGSGDARIEARIADLGLGASVTVLRDSGSEARSARLARCDAFIYPGQGMEAMPLGPLEAASVGCVPVIPAVSGLSEWLVDGVHCLKSEPGPQAFASVVRRMLDGSLDLEALSARVAAAIREDFDIDSVMSEVETELVLTAEGARVPRGTAEEFYRMALIVDARLRDHVLHGARRQAPSRRRSG